MAHWNLFTRARAPQSGKGGNPKSFQPVQYVLGRRFDPGAQAEALVPVLNNPIFFFRGNARLAGALAVFQPAQVWFNPQIGIQGLGGVQAGTVSGYPLIDPSQLDIEFEGA
jgi:hypothetical protein